MVFPRLFVASLAAVSAFCSPAYAALQLFDSRTGFDQVTANASVEDFERFGAFEAVRQFGIVDYDVGLIRPFSSADGNETVFADSELFCGAALNNCLGSDNSTFAPRRLSFVDGPVSAFGFDFINNLTEAPDVNIIQATVETTRGTQVFDISARHGFFGLTAASTGIVSVVLQKLEDVGTARSNWTVDNVTVAEAAPIPLPAGFWLMALGIGAFAARRRITR